MSKLGVSIGVFLLAIVGASAAAAQPASGPPDPPKPDVPYLVHANNLVETEQSEAVEQAKKNELYYYVDGAASTVKTPLWGPEFLFREEDMRANRLQLYRFESKNGRREILIRKKKKVMAKPIFLSLFPLKDGVVRIRVDETLSPGEYCLTPEGKDAVFCFAVE